MKKQQESKIVTKIEKSVKSKNNCYLVMKKNQNKVKSEEKKMITKAMKQDIKIHRNWFYERTSGGHIINYLNGFTAVGVFSEPQDHITEKVNTIWVYGIGFNRRGNKIIENMNLELTEDEAQDLLRCLKIALKRNK
jgi:hypothetical protein